MVKVQKNSMVLAAVVCFAGQVQAMNMDTAKGLAAASVAVSTAESVRNIVQKKSLKGNIPFGIQNELKPSAVRKIEQKIDIGASNESTGQIEQKFITLETVTVVAETQFVGLRAGNVKAGLNFPKEGSILSKLLATEAHIQGVNVETVLKASAAYLVYTQVLPRVVEKVTGKKGK